MSLVVLVVVALVGGLTTAVLAPGRPRASVAIGLVAAAAALAAAGRLHQEDGLAIGGTVLVASGALRTVSVAWAGAALLLGVLDALTVASGVVVAPALVGLAVAVLALAIPDAGAGFGLIAVGAVAGIVIPSLRSGRPDTADVGPSMRAFRVTGVASLLGIAAVAWAASPLGPPSIPRGLTGVDPATEAAVGLGLLLVVVAVILRAGAIPSHVWAARFVESVPATAVPAVLGWGSAAFALVALGWANATVGASGASIGAERALVALVAAACIILGGVAAWLHEDVEHVLGYSLVQDAGVVLLAFAWLSPAAVPAARDWAIAAAAIKTALAAWVAATRWTFGAHRLRDLSGWAVRSPLLALAFGAILVAAVGLPGMAAFRARGTLVGGAIPDLAGGLVLVAAFAPLLYLGRILVAGFGRPSAAVAAAPTTRPELRLGRTAGWSRPASPIALALAARSIPALVGGNRVPLAAATVLVLALLGLGVAMGGVGSSAAAAASVIAGS